MKAHMCSWLSFGASVLVGGALVSGCSGNSSSSEEGTVDLSPYARAAAAEAFPEGVPWGEKGGELHVYTWSDYIAPDVKAGFEKGLGVKVVIDTFDSNEAMYAKLKAGGTGYDLMMPSSYQIAQMAAEGMIEKIDHAKCPNVRKNFDPAFASQIIDASFEYNVPYAVTYTGLMYAKSKIPEGVDVESWHVLENPAFRNRITLLDDIREVIGAGLMARGFSINSTNPAEIDAAVEQVLKWKASSRKFDAESYKTEVASFATWIGHGYSTDATQVICGDEEEGLAPRDDIGFALPKEGFTIAFDEMVIAKDARQRDLAYAFINYLYVGEVAKVNMEYICGPNPVKPGLELLDEDYRQVILLPDDVRAKGQVLKGLSSARDRELYNQAWDRIKATEAK